MRPILTLAATAAFNGKIENALSPACALEMVHTYSLIHDDLPCMDNDDMRRGIPTLHKAFGEAEAVLAGDFLLTHAFQVLSEAPHLSPEQKIALVALLAKNAGGEGMIIGQLMDMDSEGQTIDLRTLEQIHHKKTGALITASVLFGGIIANASQDEMHHLEEFGRNIGLAFQIVDDLLDHVATGSDASNQKATYVTLLGIEKSKDIAAKLLNSSQKNLTSLAGDTSLLCAIAHFIISRDI